MEMTHNATFQLPNAHDLLPAGKYRVLFDEPSQNLTILVMFEPTEPKEKHKGGRKPRKPATERRRSFKARLFSTLIWADRQELLRLHAAHELLPLDIQRAPIYYLPMDKAKVQETYERRREAMQPFLCLQTLRESILMHEGLGGLIRQVMTKAQVSRAYVYQQFSALCRFGFSEISLRPRWDRCGAKGKQKLNSEKHPRQKPGRKEPAQRLSMQLYGFWGEPIQPGMTEDWRDKILAADKRIPPPKPAMQERCTQIINSHFRKAMRFNADNQLEPVELLAGQFPNNRQIARVLTEYRPKLDQLLERTTIGHFNRSLRGLIARNWQGASGPGHTWAIDSTIGDIYLVSEVNRAWIVGRPVVYIMVDVWSTAVVGFYVCLTGPSWDTAQVALFNAVAAPTLMGNLWGCELQSALYPYPTLPSILLCDRGEYLSKRAKATGMKLKVNLSYTPPYRPDLKGLVEVLHRITKNTQYRFLPGSMDARRKEYELRRSNPSEACMTVRDYVQYLYQVFLRYNLTANREKRLDAHMLAAGGIPSPAGLWRLGHAMGIGVQKALSQDDLITHLLPQQKGYVTRHGVRFCQNDYESPIVEEQQWSMRARSGGKGGWEIPVHYYPGSVSKAWTLNLADKGLIDLSISDQANASPELSYDDVLDSRKFAELQAHKVANQRMLDQLKTLQKIEAMREAAIEKTKIAREQWLQKFPTISEAKLLKKSLGLHFSSSEFRGTPEENDEVAEAHQSLLQSMFEEDRHD